MIIIARDMLTAQGFELDPAERAELAARANRCRRIITAATGYVCTDKQVMNIPVQTPEGAHIGLMTYWL